MDDLTHKNMCLEHLVYPNDMRGIEIDQRLRQRVDEVLEGGGVVCYVDFMMELVPEYWHPHFNDKNSFIVAQPMNFKEAAPVIYTMCKASVDLVLLFHPRFCLPGDGSVGLSDHWKQAEREWEILLGRLMKADPDSTVLAVNSFRVKESSMSAYRGFSPWTALADTEQVLGLEFEH